jgi:translocation and assembly module TamA
MMRGILIGQDVIPGAPRLLRVGIGINTEEFLIAKVSWKNTRLDQRGSSLDTNGRFSSQLQSVTADLNFFFLSHPSRNFFNPALELNHENRNPFEILKFKAQGFLASTWDQRGSGGSIRLGPGYNYEKTFRGTGPKNSQILSLDLRLAWVSHDFEYFQYRTSPRSGFQFQLANSLSNQAFFSSMNVNQLGMTWRYLWNFRDYDPPLWILGLRGGIFETSGADESALPVSYTYFLGGVRDLRGFGRNELPFDRIGRLSSAFASLEFRLGWVLPFGIQPLIFLDLGSFGSRSWSFELPVYWSPGVGVRWESPIGIFRATLAHGFSGGGGHSQSFHPQFFLTYGEEF